MNVIKCRAEKRFGKRAKKNEGADREEQNERVETEGEIQQKGRDSGTANQRRDRRERKKEIRNQ